MKYADVVVILSLTLRLASDRPSQTHLILSASLSTEKYHGLTREARVLPCALTKQCFICNEGWQLKLMDQITGPTAKSNYRCIFCTHSIQHWQKSQSQYFVWSCVLIMYNNIIEVNNQRVFCFFHSVFKNNIAVCADSKMTRDCSINNNKYNREKQNQTTSCVSIKPHFQNTNVK